MKVRRRAPTSPSVRRGSPRARASKNQCEMYGSCDVVSTAGGLFNDYSSYALTPAVDENGMPLLSANKFMSRGLLSASGTGGLSAGSYTMGAPPLLTPSTMTMGSPVLPPATLGASTYGAAPPPTLQAGSYGVAPPPPPP